MKFHPLRIGIVVHGRFHAFELARELLRQGADVTVLTNYPGRIVESFGVPRPRVRSLVTHGVLSRLIHRCGGESTRRLFEPRFHRWFSRWAAARLRGMRELDAIHSFSGVSEEILRRFQGGRPLLSLVRGSAHIVAQARLLAQEEERCGRPIEQPSRWVIARETREYRMADLVVVLSSFAAKTFLEEGFPPHKLRILPLGSEVARFRPNENVVRERCRRISSGEPLRILTVGSFTYQKGMYDLARIARELNGAFQFKFVGDCAPETAALRAASKGFIQFVPRQSQFLLPRQYAENDLFVFTTLQDGYAAVLAQAFAGGLPILTTPNCAGPDLVREGETGWVLPVRAPGAFTERLRWCDTHRGEVAAMVWNAYRRFHPRDWAEVASDLQRIFTDAIHSWRS